MDRGNRTMVPHHMRGDEVEEIADPGTASAEDVANKVNEVIQLLYEAGIAKRP